FILVALGAFLTIEETLNEIWEVSDKRSLRSKLLSFTLVIFWGPLVLGSSLSLYVLLRQRPGLEVLFEEAFLIQVIPLCVGTLALTMLYWQVPNTSVHFRAALAGGATAAVLLDHLRHTFGIYVASFTHRNVVIYGSFALAIFFMVSIQLAWWAVLLGCEVAYVSQYLPGLIRTQHLEADFRTDWIGLAGLVELARSLKQGKPIVPPEILSRRLGVTGHALRESFELLEDREVVYRGSRDEAAEGYLLAKDPHELRVRDLFAIYEEPVAEFLERQSSSSELRTLSEELRELWEESLGDRTLAELVER
ncbi:MAG: YhjD/YihY/BrkB family envelope integrity protein, partial [Thermoanaerobaculia bacterium]|nr:YhjD/YihY/BrkB family envelope integrity protein [Thermoanaerobaculia bacterium]